MAFNNIVCRLLKLSLEDFHPLVIQPNANVDIAGKGLPGASKDTHQLTWKSLPGSSGWDPCYHRSPQKPRSKTETSIRETGPKSETVKHEKDSVHRCCEPRNRGRL